MKAVLNIVDGLEARILGFTDKDDIVEKIILDDFKDGYSGGVGTELVKIEYEGRSIYAVRTPVTNQEDEFEYVDNDGNPINSDGSEKLDSPGTSETPQFEYDHDLWTTKEVAMDIRLDLSGSDFLLPETDEIFGAHENIVISTL